MNVFEFKVYFCFKVACILLSYIYVHYMEYFLYALQNMTESYPRKHQLPMSKDC